MNGFQEVSWNIELFICDTNSWQQVKNKSERGNT